jgi:hypothetical protein
MMQRIFGAGILRRRSCTHEEVVRLRSAFQTKPLYDFKGYHTSEAMPKKIKRARNQRGRKRACNFASYFRNGSMRSFA